MKLSDIPFGVTDWSEVDVTVHKGKQGHAFWRTMTYGPPSDKLRVRMVEYSAGYVSDHWCNKGHILLCTEGELTTRLKDGRVFVLRPGMSYQVSDDAEPHYSSTETGAKLFIVD